MALVAAEPDSLEEREVPGFDSLVGLAEKWEASTHVRQRLESLISSGKSSAPPSDQLVPLPASNLLAEVFVPNVQVAKDRGFNGFCMCLPYRPYRASPLCI